MSHLEPDTFCPEIAGRQRGEKEREEEREREREEREDANSRAAFKIMSELWDFMLSGPLTATIFHHQRVRTTILSKIRHTVSP